MSIRNWDEVFFLDNDRDNYISIEQTAVWHFYKDKTDPMYLNIRDGISQINERIPQVSSADFCIATFAMMERPDIGHSHSCLHLPSNLGIVHLLNVWKLRAVVLSFFFSFPLT